MARNRDNETVPTNEADAVEPTSEAVNPTVTEPTSEVVSETGTETGAPDTAEKTEEVKPDLPAIFQAKLEAGIEAAAGTEVIPDGPRGEIVAAYRNLRGKGREVASQNLGSIMLDMMTSNQLGTAQAVGSLIKELQTVTSQPVKREATPVDPTEELVTRIVALRSAGAYLGHFLPDGVDADKVNAGVTSATVNVDAVKAVSDMPTDSDEAKTARDEAFGKLSAIEQAVLRLVSGKGTGKATSRKSGAPRVPRADGQPRRNLDEILPQIVSSKPGVALTSQDIVNLGNELAAQPGGNEQFAGISSGAVTNWIEKDGKSRAQDAGFTVSLDPRSVTA